MSELRCQYDVTVLGGGPAGVAAASVAAERGCRTLLLENTPWLGGPIWRATDRTSVPRAGRKWLGRLERAGADVLTEATAFAAAFAKGASVLDVQDSESRRVLCVQHRGDLREVECRRLVLAAGAHELYLPFPGWTLPNCFGVGGLQLLAKSGWPVRGKRIVVAGSGPLLFAVAASLARRGAHITEMLEQAPRRRVAKFALALAHRAPAKFVQALGFQRSLLGIPYRCGSWPVAARGAEVLESVTCTNGHKTWERECDYLACAFGLVPCLEWPRLLGCRIRNAAVEVDRWQQTTVPGVYAAGEATGIGGVDTALLEGQIAGYAASGGEEESDVSKLFAARRRAQQFAGLLGSTFRLRDELMQLADESTIVCRCEDVTWGQLKDCDQPRSAKLQTRCGMGACQGRICHSAMQRLKGWEFDSVRPPVLPVRAAALAGVGLGASESEC